MIITIGVVPQQFQYFIIDNSRLVLRRRNVHWRRGWKWGRQASRSACARGRKVNQKSGVEGQLRMRGREEVGRWKWRINPNNLWNRREERKTARVHVVHMYTCERVRSRERERGRGRTGEKWRKKGIHGAIALDRAVWTSFRAPCTWRPYNPLIEGKQLKMFNRTFVYGARGTDREGDGDIQSRCRQFLSAPRVVRLTDYSLLVLLLIA